MARPARITHIQTGADRDTGAPGQDYDEVVEEMNARTRAFLAQNKAEEEARGDKVFGPGQPDGMQPKKWWQRH